MTCYFILTYHEVLVYFQNTPFLRVKETVLNAAHLEESLLELVVLNDFLQDTLVHYLSRHSLNLIITISGGKRTNTTLSLS